MNGHGSPMHIMSDDMVASVERLKGIYERNTD
jgi:hypothetical protein